MAWRSDEVWLDADVLWFHERPALAVATVADVPLPPGFTPVETGLVASRRRRLEAQSERRHRLATRTVPAVALVVGSATMLSIAGLRQAAAGQGARPLLEDPPSLTFRLPGFRFEPPDAPVRSEPPKPAEPAPIEWNRATSSGLWYGGRLANGTQLPVAGADWVTWNPVTDERPNLPGRLHGHERTIRTILRVVGDHRAAYPNAPQVLVGDISFPGGGVMNEHVSHQNGLDVDVYYPRLDRWLQPPRSSSQVDRELAQDLLDRFLAAGAKVVFVGYSTGLTGDPDAVVPYPNHENHMHVRFPG